MNNYHIAIVNSSSFGKVFDEHFKRLEQLGKVDFFTFPIDIDGKSLAEALAGYNIIISSVTPFFNQAFFDHKDELLLISRHGIGFNNVDIKAANKHNTIVSIVEAEVERVAVAELAIALLMTTIRQIIPAQQAVIKNQWSSRASFMGSEIKGKTVGIIGFGNIGSHVGQILHLGFKANVIAYDPYKSEEEIALLNVQKVDLETLLKTSDIISLNAYLNQDSYHMLDKKAFSLMKQGVYIVNTARGELMEEDALIEALSQNKIAALGIDVVENEPIDSAHPLLAFPQVIVTPHIAAYTYECLRGMGKKVLSDVEAIINDQTVINTVNHRE